MSPDEFDMIRAAIKSAYPSFNIMPDTYSVNLWYKMLGDIDYDTCQYAVLELISTRQYPPQIADIRAKCAEYLFPDIKDAGEAWEELMTAVRKFGYYSADELLESLSEPTKNAAIRLGLQEICMTDNVVATRAHFFKIYDAIVSRKIDDYRLPELVRKAKEHYRLENSAAEKPAAEIEKKNDEKNVLPDTDNERATPEYIHNLINGLRKRGFRQ